MSDIVIDDAAQVVCVTVGAGGFLCLGERRVLLPIDDIRLVQMPQVDGFSIVTRLSAEEVEAAKGHEGLIGDS